MKLYDPRSKEPVVLLDMAKMEWNECIEDNRHIYIDYAKNRTEATGQLVAIGTVIGIQIFHSLNGIDGGPGLIMVGSCSWSHFS